MGELPEDRIRTIHDLLKQPVFIHRIIRKRVGFLIDIAQENKIEIRAIFINRTGLKILLYISGKTGISIGFVIQVGIVRAEYIEIPSIGNSLGNGNLRTKPIKQLGFRRCPAAAKCQGDP